MYRELAEHYDRIYSGKDYAGESAQLAEAIRARVSGARSLLDVACGTGGHLRFLKDHFECEGVDLSEQMLSIARGRLPGMMLHVGDMESFDLGKKFDAVTCLFSAVGHLVTVERLNRAVRRMSEHMSDSGVLIIEPWITPEKWITGHLSMDAFDGDEVKIARVFLSEPVERGRLVFQYLVGTKARVEHFSEEHRMGWFTHEEYVGAFEQAGLRVSHDAEGLNGRGLYIARR